MLVKVNTCYKDRENWIIEVDSHKFYIEGKGGQLGDRGTIGERKVLNILNENKIIVDREIPTGEYTYTIDEERVKDIAVQHTSQHLFSAIAFNDYNLNTVGFRMAENYTTVDLDNKDLDENFVREIEKKVNKAIFLGKSVKINVYTREEANRIEGFRKQISEKVVGDVRVVEIEDYDINACAGYHVDNLKDIRIFKIINFEKVKGNYTRFYFLAGERAIEDYNFKNSITRELNKKFSCKDFEILEMVEKNFAEIKKLENQNREILNLYCQNLAKELENNAIIVDENRYILYSGNMEIANTLSKFISEEFTYIGVWEEGGIVLSKKIHCGELVKKLSQTFGVKGGGKNERANFKGKIPIEEVTNLL